MITVTFHNLSYDEELRLPEADGSVVSISIEGHAVPGGLFAEADRAETIPTAKGENMVCAAVSFAGLNLVRSLGMVAGAGPEYTIESGSLRVSVDTAGLDKEKLAAVRVLVESFLIGMLDIERKYKSFIAINIH